MSTPPSKVSAAYRQAGAAVTPIAALIRLYDETILAVGQAVAAIEQKQHETSFLKVQRASTILRGLDHALDFEAGGEVSERLHRVYNSYILALHASYGKPDVIERYRILLDGLRALREAWVHVARLQNGHGGA